MASVEIALMADGELAFDGDVLEQMAEADRKVVLERIRSTRLEGCFQAMLAGASDDCKLLTSTNQTNQLRDLRRAFFAGAQKALMMLERGTPHEEIRAECADFVAAVRSGIA